MGRASAFKAELRPVEDDIAILDKAEKLFFSGAVMDGVTARRKRSHIFRRGELAKHVLTGFRQKPPRAAIEIAKEIKGWTKLRQDILPNVERCLRKQTAKGVLEKVGETFRRQKLWKIWARAQATIASPVVKLAFRP